MERNLSYWYAMLGLLVLTGECLLVAAEPAAMVDLWPDLAPGESVRAIGEPLPRRADEQPPATRIRGITSPQLARFDPPAGRRTGAAALIFPGGGYNYVVVDKEGSEAAEWLNGLGITACVVRYRTRVEGSAKGAEWLRPLQDGQRAVSLVRQHAAEWGLKSDQIGILGFSAGGQLGALVATRFVQRAYEPKDAVDQVSCRPDFAMLIYPWQLLNAQTGKLADFLPMTREVPPTFLVHAHNDRSTSMNSIAFYAALRELGIPAELHVYESGGHGFGMRPVAGSHVHSWPQRAAEWLRQRQLARSP
jgi:acetyl esterase/lipase